MKKMAAVCTLGLMLSSAANAASCRERLSDAHFEIDALNEILDRKEDRIDNLLERIDTKNAKIESLEKEIKRLKRKLKPSKKKFVVSGKTGFKTLAIEATSTQEVFTKCIEQVKGNTFFNDLSVSYNYGPTQYERSSMGYWNAGTVCAKVAKYAQTRGASAKTKFKYTAQGAVGNKTIDVKTNSLGDAMQQCLDQVKGNSYFADLNVLVNGSKVNSVKNPRGYWGQGDACSIALQGLAR